MKSECPMLHCMEFLLPSSFVKSSCLVQGADESHRGAALPASRVFDDPSDRFHQHEQIGDGTKLLKRDELRFICRRLGAQSPA
jgi:hypothetical protein